MRKLRALEDVLIRVESILAVVLVLTMLLLAAYNVVYRNVLVPMQQHWAHSGPPPERPSAPDPAPETRAETKGETNVEAGGAAKPEPKAEPAAADDFGGFGGALGEDEEPADEPDAVKPPEEKAGADDFGGFGSELDDEAEPEPAKVEPAKAEPASDDFGGFSGEAKGEPAKAEPASDDFGGFGGGTKEPEEKAGADDFGGFGGEAKAPDVDEDADDDLGEDDFGDGDDPFANLADIDAAGKQEDTGIPQGGPPPAGSFAAWAVDFIDAIKLDWIDVFLRQLVIIVAFFGAMLATQRGKHINIDALSKVLPNGARRVVAVVLPLSAVTVCLMLASAGWDLVQISREYPKDVLPSIPEWTFQLMFPVGFGLLAAHFTLRVIEAVVEPPPLDAKPTPQPVPAAAIEAAAVEAADAEAADADDDSQSGGSR